jgi:hypothetical protein
MNKFKLITDAVYLNMSGQLVKGRKGTVVVMPRRSDVKKYLATGAMEPADSATRETHTMTTKNIMRDEGAEVVPFEINDYVGFVHEGEEATGEVKSISAKGVLAVDIGVEDAEKIVRVNPEKVKVERIV